MLFVSVDVTSFSCSLKWEGWIDKRRDGVIMSNWLLPRQWQPVGRERGERCPAPSPIISSLLRSMQYREAGIKEDMNSDLGFTVTHMDHKIYHQGSCVIVIIVICLLIPQEQGDHLSRTVQDITIKQPKRENLTLKCYYFYFNRSVLMHCGRRSTCLMLVHRTDHGTIEYPGGHSLLFVQICSEVEERRNKMVNYDYDVQHTKEELTWFHWCNANDKLHDSSCLLSGWRQ